MYFENKKKALSRNSIKAVGLPAWAESGECGRGIAVDCPLHIKLLRLLVRQL